MFVHHVIAKPKEARQHKEHNEREYKFERVFHVVVEVIVSSLYSTINNYKEAPRGEGFFINVFQGRYFQ
jgi:hypothetical protein